MRMFNMKYVPVLLCLMSTLVQRAAFWLEVVIPYFPILDSDSTEEECGLFPGKPILMKQTQIYFLIVTVLFFSHFLSFPEERSLITAAKKLLVVMPLHHKNEVKRNSV